MKAACQEHPPPLDSYLAATFTSRYFQIFTRAKTNCFSIRKTSYQASGSPSWWG